MGKKYLDTKENSIESAVLQVWQEAAKKLDPVGQADKDIDNDGDVDSSDSYLHNRRKAISKEIKKDKKKSPEQVDEIVGKLAGKVLGGAGKAVGTAAKLAGRTAGLAGRTAGAAAAGAIKGTKKAVGGAASGTKKAVGGAASATKKVVGSITSQYNEGTKQVLAHGGKGQYKAVRDGGITKIMYKGKVVGTADFDRGADSFFVSMKGVKGQKSFDDAQAMVDYFAKNKITEELEMRDFNEYQNFKVQSMRSAIEEVWATSADDKLFEDINFLSEEDYDDFLESLNEEELNELIRALGRGIKKVATMGTAASRADRAEKKLAKAQKRGADLARVKAAKEKTSAAREANPTLGMKAGRAVSGAAKKIMGKPKTVTSKAGNKMVAGPDGKATTTRAEGVDLDEDEVSKARRAELMKGYKQKHKIGQKAGGVGALDKNAPHNVRAKQIAGDDEKRSHGPAPLGYKDDAARQTKHRLGDAQRKRKSDKRNAAIASLKKKTRVDI